MCWVIPPASDFDHFRLADGVEQRGLAVVDVSHDGHNGCPWREIGRIVDERLRAFLLLFGVLDLHLALELLGQDEDGIVGERLGDGDHLAQPDEGLDEFAGAYLQSLAQVLDAGAALDLDGRVDSGRGLLLGDRLLRFGNGCRAGRAGCPCHPSVRPENR